MGYILWCLFGIIVGSIITSAIFLFKRSYGVLRIDRTNPEKDVYRLDVLDLDTLSKRKRIVFKIDNNADLSQK